MTRLEHYLDDGANYQARAVLMYLQHRCYIESSWDDNAEKYEAVLQVGRWENFREQGYVVSLDNKKREQLNIAFFEHRNSDDICAVRWKQTSLNTLTIETAKFGDIYKTKFDVSFEVSCGEVIRMSDWIIKEFTEHWLSGIK